MVLVTNHTLHVSPLKYFYSLTKEQFNTREIFFFKETMVNHKKMVHPPDMCC